MAALSAAELANVANAALDYYIDKGTVYAQSLQDKPLLAAMEKNAKKFPGGKGDVSLAVKGAYTTTVEGYKATDTVTYANPANIQRVNYTWREHHAGISVTLTELKHDGITVTDSTTGENTSSASGRESTMLANLLEDKLDDMMEGYARGMNDFLYGDGTADADALAGIQTIIADDPAAANASVGGLRTDQNTWWRNRSNYTSSGSDIAVTASGQELTDKLHTEIRQLRRYGGRPSIAVCGSDFLDRLATELKNKGNYTQTGWSGGGKSTDFSIGQITYEGIKFEYDPTLDDLTITGNSPSKRCYIIDPTKLYLMYMDGEKMVRHSPARPHDSYVIYRAITTTAVLCASQLNCHGVYEIA